MAFFSLIALQSKENLFFMTFIKLRDPIVSSTKVLRSCTEWAVTCTDVLSQRDTIPLLTPFSFLKDHGIFCKELLIITEEKEHS